MNRRSLVLNARDNVAAALNDLEAGEQVCVFIPGGAEQTITLQQAIPLGHKFALRAIASGSVIVKQGLPIGLATQEIACGEHVHIHNVTGEGLDRHHNIKP